MITTTVEARILVVEDDAIVARDIEDSLTACGYQVVAVATDAEEAVELARRSEPDLVLMDIRLPGGADGIEAATAIREDLDIPVVYLTAYSDPGTLERAKRSGTWGYVVKPFDGSGLRAAIEVALHRHHADALLRESEERFRATVEAVTEGIVATDAEGRITFVNPGAEFLLARSARELVGRRASEVIHVANEQGHPLQDPVEAALRENGTVYLTGRNAVRIPGGRLFPIRGSVSIMRSTSGKRLGSVMALVDASIPREVERRLREREARYRELCVGGPWASFVVDASGVVLECNQVFPILAGATEPGGVVGRSLFELIGGPEPFEMLAARARAEGRVVSVEHSFVRKPVKKTRFLLTLQPDPEDPTHLFGRLIELPAGRGRGLGEHGREA